jgi:heme exporter protein D
MVAWSAFTAWCRKVWTFGKGWLAVVFAITTVCLTILVVIQAVAIRQRDTVISWGSVSEAFGAPGTTLAVVVALWQSIVIRRQAKDQAAEAAKQFQAEVDAANARTV